MRVKICFSYDGSLFYGYQKQDGLRTIQEELEKAVSYLNGQKSTKTVASGRTDRGVHAKCQVAHFDLEKSIPCNKIKMGLNSLLPDDIYVLSAEEVSAEFHARYLAKSKEYVYELNMGEYDPLQRNYCYQLGKKLDVSKMMDASKVFLGRHDFRSFVDSEDVRENTIREVYEIEFLEEDDILRVRFCGNGFMKYQVRNMMGALVLVGLGKKTKDELEELLITKSRKKAWKAVPASGLYLEKVNY